MIQKICKYCHSRLYKDWTEKEVRWKMRGNLLHTNNPPNWCTSPFDGITRLHMPMNNLDYLEWKYDKTL